MKNDPYRPPINRPGFFVTAVLAIAVLDLFMVIPGYTAETAGPEILWSKIYGRGADGHGYAVKPTADGGYIITGGLGDKVFLLKTSEYGDSLWMQQYGKMDSDAGHSVEPTADGGYIIAGYTSSFDGDPGDVYLIKTDDKGNTIWNKTYGGTDLDRGYSVKQIADSGYIIAGYSESFLGNETGNIYLIQTDCYGDTIWTKDYGGTDTDCGYSLNLTADGGYIIAGNTSPTASNDSGNVILVKTDKDGNEIWSREYGGDGDDCGYAVEPTSDGGYIIVGYTHSDTHITYSDVYLIKTDSLGDSVWCSNFGGSYSDYGYDIQPTSDGGYIIAGASANYDSTGTTSLDVYLVKTDADGGITWRVRYGGNEVDCGYSVRMTSDGGYIIAGYSNSFGNGSDDIYLIKTKPVIVLFMPVGGETWSGGSVKEIKWQPENTPGHTYKYRLLLSLDSGLNYADTIAANLGAETCSFDWEVPELDCRTCRLKVQLYNPSGYVLSEKVCDDDFVIDTSLPIIDSTTIWLDTSYPGPFEVTSRVSDVVSGVDSVVLHYRRDEDSGWEVSPMGSAALPDWFFDSIPAVAGSVDTVRYYIVAFDRAANWVSDPPDGYYQFIVTPTGISDDITVPKRFFFAHRSNPVTGPALFQLTMPAAGKIRLRIYDILGGLVETLVDGERPAGLHEIRWPAEVSSGIYFYRLESPWTTESGKLVFIR